MSSSSPPPPPFLTTLSAVGWVWVGLLVLDVAVSIVSAVLGALPGDARTVGNQVGQAVVVALPTLFLIGVVADFARFFGRVGVGEVFTEQNLKTLRSGGEGLLVAAVASAVVVPTILGWIRQTSRGIAWELNDLALGVAAMGFVVAGLAYVFQEAVRLQRENDAFV